MVGLDEVLLIRKVGSVGLIQNIHFMQNSGESQFKAAYSHPPVKALYKLSSNKPLKFHLRRIAPSQCHTAIDYRAPNGEQKRAVKSNDELQRMREACEKQFQLISSLIGRPFWVSENWEGSKPEKEPEGRLDTTAEWSGTTQPKTQSPFFEEEDGAKPFDETSQRLHRNLFEIGNDPDQFFVTDTEPKRYIDFQDFL